MPPTAATIGSSAVRRSANSPTRNSRLISSPTLKKKIAIKPSLIQWRRSRRNICSPIEMPSGTRRTTPTASWPRRAPEWRRPRGPGRRRPVAVRTAGTAAPRNHLRARPSCDPASLRYAPDRAISWFADNEPRTGAPVSRATWQQVRTGRNHPRRLCRSVRAAPCVAERASTCVLSYRRGHASWADSVIVQDRTPVPVVSRERVACRCGPRHPGHEPPKKAP